MASLLFLETTRDTSKHVAPLGACNRQTLENRKNAEGEAETLLVSDFAARSAGFSKAEEIQPTVSRDLSLSYGPSFGRKDGGAAASEPVCGSWSPSVVDVLVHAVVQQSRRRQLPAAGILELEQVSHLADHTQRLHTQTDVSMWGVGWGGGCRLQQNEIFMEGVCHVRNSE